MFSPPIGAPEEPASPATELLPKPLQGPQLFPIDLPTALRLADGQNPQIQFARERILAAEAALDRANVLLLPNLLGGGEWLRHDGQLQDVRGAVIPVSKSSLFAGGGFRTSIALADAYFEPLAARQFVRRDRMALCNVSTDEQEMLHVLHLDQAWPICASRREALTAVMA